jgi:hypothetical protein
MSGTFRKIIDLPPYPPHQLRSALGTHNDHWLNLPKRRNKISFRFNLLGLQEQFCAAVGMVVTVSMNNPTRSIFRTLVTIAGT